MRSITRMVIKPIVCQALQPALAIPLWISSIWLALPPPQLHQAILNALMALVPAIVRHARNHADPRKFRQFIYFS